jgi:hypothetical protein
VAAALTVHLAAVTLPAHSRDTLGHVPGTGPSASRDTTDTRKVPLSREVTALAAGPPVPGTRPRPYGARPDGTWRACSAGGSRCSR